MLANSFAHLAHFGRRVVRSGGRSTAGGTLLIAVPVGSGACNLWAGGCAGGVSHKRVKVQNFSCVLHVAT